MGYNTDFTGELSFGEDVTLSQVAHLKDFLGKDRRDLGYTDNSIYQNGKYGSHWYHINLELTDDLTGIRWNGCEKTYDLEYIINWLCDTVTNKFGQFELHGELLAQGEDPDDRYKIVMVDGVAERIEYPKIGEKIICPCCESEFTLDGDDQEHLKQRYR